MEIRLLLIWKPEMLVMIRKVSIGPDYKTAMHYLVGQKVIDGEYIIHAIMMEGFDIRIWIENKRKEVVAWKSFNSNMPMTIEYNIEF